MAGVAAHHGRSRVFDRGVPVEDVQREAEQFATGEFAAFLTRGAAMEPDERERVLARLADLIGLPVDLGQHLGQDVRTGISRYKKSPLSAACNVAGLSGSTVSSAISSVSTASMPSCRNVG